MVGVKVVEAEAVLVIEKPMVSVLAGKIKIIDLLLITYTFFR